MTFKTTYDYETMLEVDRDIVLDRYTIASYYDIGGIRKQLESNPIGSKLTAVKTTPSIRPAIRCRGR